MKISFTSSSCFSLQKGENMSLAAGELCIPTPTHTMVIPDFYSSSSAIPQILSPSQTPSCLTSSLLSPQILCPQMPAFPLSLRCSARGIGHQTTSPAADAKPKPATSLLSGNSHRFAQNLSDVGITVSVVSPAVSLSNSVQQVQES